MRLKSAMTPSMYRALAHTFYSSGADGVSTFNHFVAHLWIPPFYPQSLQVFQELRDPERVAAGERHYIFDPTWGGVIWQGMDVSTSGVVKAQRVVLDRGTARPTGVFRFRMYERMDRVRGATILVRGADLAGHDELEVQLNGVTLEPGLLGKAVTRTREVNPDTRWFRLPAAAPSYGDNQLHITLADGDPNASGDLVIDEVEVWVQP